MTVRTLHQLFEQSMLYCPTRDGLMHLLHVTSAASRIGRYGHFLEMLNRLACRDGETILLFRDGRTEELSFFWKNIPLVTHGELLSKAQGFREPTLTNLSYTIDLKHEYEVPSKTYHGGLICRTQYDPIEWTIHT